MAKHVIVGIDPGKDGGIAAWTEGTILVWKWPKIGKEYDLRAANEIFKAFAVKGHTVTVVVEHITVPHKMGRTSAFSFGKGCILPSALAIAHGYRLIEVPPKEWQKEMHLGIPVQKKADGKTRDLKKMSEIAVKNLYPSVDMLKPKGGYDDGKGEALLIMEYGIRKFT